jgi:hypothetical protein
MLPDRASFELIVGRIADAIHARTGFSLIRLGEGEGPFLDWHPAQSREDISASLNVWFGRSSFDDNELATMAEGLRRAARSADILGLPTSYQLGVTPRYGMVMEGVRKHRLYTPAQLVVDANIHWYLQWSGAMAYLLRDLDFLGVIGCRDIGARIGQAFGIGSVHCHLVRGEHGYPGSTLAPHWPDGYSEVMRALDATAGGQVFLIGAGILGKLYCARIRSLGGVALDVGSLLDSWAGVPSRKRYERDSRAFTLDHFAAPTATLEQMKRSLAFHIAEFDIREPTI